jgi:hypothetical protein
MDLDRVGAGIGPGARGGFDRANQTDETGLAGRHRDQLADVPQIGRRVFGRIDIRRDGRAGAVALDHAPQQPGVRLLEIASFLAHCFADGLAVLGIHHRHVPVP